MKVKPYRKYKATGIGWLDAVPDEWTLTKIKHVTSFTTGWTPPTGDSESFEGKNLWANISDLGPKILTETVKRISDEAIKRSNIAISPKGSLLFSFKLSIGQVGLAGCDLYTNEAIATFLPNHSARLDYLFYASTIYIVENTSFNIYGAKLLNQQLINSAFIALPNQADQKLIANFLDRETTKLDTLISKQGRLIELLQEKRQAVISHAVTKGLNPDAKLKDSGVEWLGMVPEGWEVKRLGYLTKKIGSGKTPFGGADTYSNEGILFIRSQNVYDDGLRLDDVVYISEEIDLDMKVSRVFSRDILLNITGASIGRTCIVPNEFGRANVNQHVCIIRLNNENMSGYVSQVMKSNSIKSQIDFSQNGAGREGLNFPQIANLAIGIPSELEQSEIINYLKIQTAKIDILIDKAKRSIELANEHRTALISAAVTGKIDLREIA